MVELIEAAWPMRREIVPCLVGPPGIGKTAAVELVAQRHESKMVKLVASRCVPSETVGMTIPIHETKSMEIYNSMQLKSLGDGDVLFLDELLEADQFVLSTLLTVIESREMADGTPLPDIMIVAATNETTSSSQIKPNIRQRFMFKRFKMDPRQTSEYIYRMTGMEIPSSKIDNLFHLDDRDYNFYSPRSVTKLALWMSESEEPERLAHIICNMWGSDIGNDLLKYRKNRDAKVATPEMQVRNAVRKIIPDIDSSLEEHDVSIDDCTMSQLLEVLQSLPNWESKIKNILANMDVMEVEGDKEVDITF